MAMVTAHLCTGDGENDNCDNREYDSNSDEDNLYQLTSTREAI